MSVSSIRLFVRPSVPFEELWKVCVSVCVFLSPLHEKAAMQMSRRRSGAWRDFLFVQLSGKRTEKQTPFNTFWQNTPFSVSLLLVFMTHQTINQIAANLHQISAIAATTVWRLFSIRSCSGSARELEIGTRAGLFCYGYVPFHSIRLCSGSAFWIWSWISGLLLCMGMCMCVS